MNRDSTNTVDERYLYGKLIAILLDGYIQNFFNEFVEEKIYFKLTEWKAHKILKKTSKSFGGTSENKWLGSKTGQLKSLKNYGIEPKRKEKNTLQTIYKYSERLCKILA